MSKLWGAVHLAGSSDYEIEYLQSPQSNLGEKLFYINTIYSILQPQEESLSQQFFRLSQRFHCFIVILERYGS